MRKQLIFCQTFDAPLPEETRDEAFVLCWTLGDIFVHTKAALKALGLADFIKGVLKIATGKRKLYAVALKGRWVHWGWISLSFSRYYPVKKNDAIIGPIWTVPDYRGKRVATFALTKTINRLIQQGYRTVYIDTDETNYPCLKVIQLCRFGDTIGSFYKP